MTHKIEDAVFTGDALFIEDYGTGRNIDAGRLPQPRANGRRYLTIPLDLKKPTHDDGTPVR